MSDFFLKFPEVHLGDIVMREFKVDDAKDFYEYMQSENIKKFTAENVLPRSVSMAEDDITYWIDDYVHGRNIHWAIADVRTNKLVGTCGFNFWNKQHRRLEISYDVQYEYWGRGIATRVVSKVSELVFQNMGAQRIQGTVITDNVASIKVLERCGYVREGLLSKYFRVHGEVRDAYMYSRVASHQ